MKLLCFGSSSDGNSYLLRGEKESLIIDCGVPIGLLREKVDFRRVVGCLVSHRHCDHVGKKFTGMETVMKAGVSVCAPYDVWLHYKGRVIKNEPIEPFKPKKIGSFTVVAMPVWHDIECYAYLIHHSEMGKLLFATDCHHGLEDYDFDKLNHIMIECNWEENAMKKAIAEGRTKQYVADRSAMTHMRVDDTCEFVGRSEMENVKTVVLLHLSKENGDEKLFLERVSAYTDAKVYIAKCGMEMEL